MKGKLALAALALILALVIASCGGGASSPGGSSGGGGSSGSGKATTGGSSGYGGGNASSSSAPTTTKAGSSPGGVLKTIVIKETEFELSPSSVTLSKPGTYAFEAENEGSVEHNLKIEGEGVKGEGGQVGEAKLDRNLRPGGSGVLRVSFRKSGTYEMYCPVIGHRLAGMKGSVVVR